MGRTLPKGPTLKWHQTFAFFYRLKPKENPDAAGAAACTSALPLLDLVSLNSFDSLACSSACKTTQACGRQIPGQLHSTSCGKPMWEPPRPAQPGNTNRTLRCFACRSASSACITSGFCFSRASTKRWCRFVLQVSGQATETLDKALVGNAKKPSSQRTASRLSASNASSTRTPACQTRPNVQAAPSPSSPDLAASQPTAPPLSSPTRGHCGLAAGTPARVAAWCG